MPLRLGTPPASTQQGHAGQPPRPTTTPTPDGKVRSELPCRTTRVAMATNDPPDLAWPSSNTCIYLWRQRAGDAWRNECGIGPSRPPRVRCRLQAGRPTVGPALGEARRCTAQRAATTAPLRVAGIARLPPAPVPFAASGAAHPWRMAMPLGTGHHLLCSVQPARTNLFLRWRVLNANGTVRCGILTA